jgi:hypothetical protein
VEEFRRAVEGIGDPYAGIEGGGDTVEGIVILFADDEFVREVRADDLLDGSLRLEVRLRDEVAAPGLGAALDAPAVIVHVDGAGCSGRFFGDGAALRQLRLVHYTSPMTAKNWSMSSGEAA